MPEAAPEPTPPARRPLRRVAQVLLPLAGIAALGYLFQRIGWQALGAALRRLGPETVGAVLLLGLGEVLLDAESLRRALLGRIGFAWTLASNSTGSIVNLVVPFEAGEVVKAALLRRRSTESRILSGLVIWNYVWKVSKPSLGLAGFLTALLLGHAFGASIVWPVAAGVVLSFVPYLALRILIRIGAAERGTRLLGRLPVLRRKAPGWAQGAARLDSEVRLFWKTHPRVHAQIFALQVLGRFAVLLSLAVLARGLGLPTDAGTVGMLYAAFVTLDYVTMVFPSRVGLSESAAYLLFHLLGWDPALGLLIELVLRVRSLIVQAPLALGVLGGARTPAPKP